MEYTKSRIITSVFLLLALIAIFYAMGQWLIPFVIALILAYAFHAPTKSISTNLKISSSISAGIVVSLMVSIFAFLAIFLVPLFKNAAMVLINKLPRLMQTAPASINDLLHRSSSSLGIDHTFDVSASFQKYVGQVTSDLPNHILNFINTGVAVVYVVIFAIMTPLITYYLLKDWSKIENSIVSILAKFSSTATLETIKNINKKLAAYTKGQLLICCILSVLYSVALYFIGVKEFLVCGIFSGFLSFAPFFGPLLGLLATLAMSIDDFSFTYQYTLTMCLYAAIPLLDSNFITPKLIGKTTGIQPFWLLFSICATVSVLGIAGVFISVPMAVAISTICKEIVKKL